MLVRTRLVVASVAVCLLAVPVLPARSADTPAPRWSGVSSMLGGTERYDAGEWIYQDFVYDDGGRLNNTADIVELRIALAGDDLDFRVTFNSLLATDSTVVGVALGSASVAQWPMGANVKSPSSRFVTVAAGEARDADGSSYPATVDLDANTVSFRVPDAAKLGDQLRLAVGAGAWDAKAKKWTADGVVDLAFNTNAAEPYGKNFRDTVQQQAIASGDVSSIFATVDLGALRSRRVDPAITAPGLYNRVFRSRQALGEGYGPAFPRHRGLFQPYALYIPTAYDGRSPTPLTLVMHSLNNIHNEYSATNVYKQLAEERGSLAITPLALGVDGWYWDEALVDSLDAWADVRRHYAVDEDRTSVSGYSMGGYASYRLATLMPDTFAAAALWSGVPAFQIWAYPAPPVPTGARQGPGNTYGQLESTYHVPFFISHGSNDQLVPISGVDHQASRFMELGHEHRFNHYVGVDHYSFRSIDDWSMWRDWLGNRRRVTDPARVAFKVRPYSWVTSSRPPADQATIRAHLDALADLDSAYWVRDVKPRGEGDVTAFVDLTAENKADRKPVTKQVSSTHQGAPYAPGAPVQAGPPFLYTQRGLDRSFADAAKANVLSGTLTNVAEITVDLGSAGLQLQGLDVKVKADQPVVFHFIEGATVETARLADGRVTGLDDLPDTLPATGRAAPVAAGLVLLGGAFAVSRARASASRRR